MRRKSELIQEIRAMESVPLIRTRFVDLTETAGQGLLAEMSVSEVGWGRETMQHRLATVPCRLCQALTAQSGNDRQTSPPCSCERG